MLILKNIVKEYTAGNTRIKTLKGINIDFRENELVSILGPPNCGKTTMLNILCGLDIYTSGNLSVNGKSTKGFSNRDWDAFRNNSIGLMLQRYNLISHETALANVELTMKLSGEAKFERRARAIAVLKKVGICDKFNKKPNQMSYGEIKRVTIARALVNDPDVLIADEPTETLDLETSIKIMEILKEISKDKLVIMVNNDLEIAQKYSTRIIKLFDGKVIYDSNPYHVVVEKPTRNEKGKKTSMSLLTALSLSLNSLMTKKGKTFITSFIASSGIIGIALILLLSSGATTSSMKIRCKFIVFALISLVVSLISISTSIYISVLERTKEIGVLRSIGVSRKDIFLVFNAETLIIGLVSDVIGFCIIYVLGIFKLPATSWMVIVIISMVVHLMAGFIPSIIAAKKDYFLELKNS
ncbi:MULTISPECIES: ATP-binding cassette domain-containing protein [Clostridium]|uniref:ABC transporter ATP-binding protein/permease n=1 Tax=Clostridium frigoriphilum TaxID=443253 RepID=A0ABU7ULS2_9CLOT|nr:ABC transporter ATP-binding protein/permease [Clostridium sp. DSM 17811]